MRRWWRFHLWHAFPAGQTRHRGGTIARPSNGLSRRSAIPSAALWLLALSLRKHCLYWRVRGGTVGSPVVHAEREPLARTSARATARKFVDRFPECHASRLVGFIRRRGGEGLGPDAHRL